MEKTCSKCKDVKSVTEFYKSGKGYYSQCKECCRKAKKAEYSANKAKINERCRKYYDGNKKKICEQKKTYYEINKERIIERMRLKYNSDINVRIATSIRRRTREFMGAGDSKYMDLIGCLHSQLRKWFEFNFELDEHTEMSWENFKTLWQIDHVFPLSVAIKKGGDVSKYFLWTNLRPTLRSYNASKHNKIKIMDLILVEIRIKLFKKQIQSITNDIVDISIYNEIDNAIVHSKNIDEQEVDDILDAEVDCLDNSEQEL
jgi:hypothetical protein